MKRTVLYFDLDAAASEFKAETDGISRLIVWQTYRTEEVEGELDSLVRVSTEKYLTFKLMYEIEDQIAPMGDTTLR